MALPVYALHQIVAYFNGINASISLDKLMTDLSLTDEIISNCSSFLIVDRSSGLISLDQNKVSKLYWITPQIVYYREPQRIINDSLLPITEDMVRKSLMPLILEQGLLLKSIKLQKLTDKILVKIKYFPGAWCLERRELSFIAANKNTAKLTQTIDELAANGMWEKWHCYQQALQHVGEYSVGIKYSMIDAMIKIVNADYHFHGVPYKLSWPSKRSLMIPYTTSSALMYSRVRVVGVEGSKSSFKEYSYNVLSKIELEQFIDRYNSSSKKNLDSIRFLPQHVTSVQQFIVDSPTGIDVLASTELPIEERSLWIELCSQDDGKSVWLYKTHKGDFSTHQLVPEFARDMFRAQLQRIVPPCSPSLPEKRQLAAGTSFFPPPKEGAKVVRLEGAKVVRFAAELDESSVAVKPDADYLDDPEIVAAMSGAVDNLTL